MRRSIHLPVTLRFGTPARRAFAAAAASFLLGPWAMAADGSRSAVLPDGKYECYMLAGSSLQYAFIDIHVSGNSYRDRAGKSGRLTVAADDRIRFTGPLAGASAKLLSGERIGLNMDGGNFYNTTCSRRKG